MTEAADRSLPELQVLDPEMTARLAVEQGIDDARAFSGATPPRRLLRDYWQQAQRAGAAAVTYLLHSHHFGEERIEDDQRRGRAKALVAGRVAITRDLRLTCEEHLRRWTELLISLPLSAMVSVIPARLTRGVQLVFALASSAAVAAALYAATWDPLPLSILIGIGAALSAVVGGAALGSHLKVYALDNMGPTEWSPRGAIWRGVAILGVAGIVGIAIGIAGLRATATAQDELRAREDTSVQLLVPTGDDAGALVTESSEGSPSVSVLTWLLLELAIAAASLSLEFQSANPRRKLLEQVERAAQSSRAAWKSSHEQLSQGVANFESVISAGVNRDAEVILAADSQEAATSVLPNLFREARRRHSDDKEEVFLGDATTEASSLSDSFRRNPGIPTIELLGGSRLQADHDPVPGLVPNEVAILKLAYEELERLPMWPISADPQPTSKNLDADGGFRAATLAVEGTDRIAGTSTSPGVDPARRAFNDPPTPPLSARSGLESNGSEPS